MKITLQAPVVTQEEITVSEVDVNRVVELYNRNKVVAFTSVGSFTLWEGAELDAINATPEQWTDSMVVAKLEELINA